MAERGAVRPVLALAFSVVGFVALSIAALGVLSLLRDEDIIVTTSVGQVPAVLGVAVSAGLFAASVWLAVRSGSPSPWSGPVAAAAAFLGYLGGVFAGVLLVLPDLGPALGAVARVTTSGYAIVVAAAGLLAGLGAVALVRAPGGHPRWPWERR